MKKEGILEFIGIGVFVALASLVAAGVISKNTRAPEGAALAVVDDHVEPAQPGHKEPAKTPEPHGHKEPAKPEPAAVKAPAPEPREPAKPDPKPEPAEVKAPAPEPREPSKPDPDPEPAAVKAPAPEPREPAKPDPKPESATVKAPAPEPKEPAKPEPAEVKAPAPKPKEPVKPDPKPEPAHAKAPANDRVSYELDEDAFELNVTGYGPFGDQTIDFFDCTGELKMVPGNPETSTFHGEIIMELMDNKHAKLLKSLSAKEFFDVKGHPEAYFSSSAVKKTAGGYEITGTLEIKGIKKKIKYPATITETDDELRIEAEFRVLKSWWGLVYSATLLEIKDEALIRLDLTFSK
ncbi:MAG: YceI family protein, partial [Verrucomicrobiota bacterium]